MIFFSVVFTLQGRKASENKYINMFWLMFQSLYKSGTFDPTRDNMYVMADEASWDMIQARWNFTTPFIYWIRIPPPRTLLEGIARRYEFFDLAEIRNGATALYLDVDFLCLKKFEVALPPDTIAVLPEGGSADPNYCGEGAWAQLDHAGLSAGFWAVCIGPDMRALMYEIIASVARGPHNFYTCEQPHFNAAITKKTRAVSFEPAIVSFNGHGNIKAAYFINFAGCPGDAEFHFQKMRQVVQESQS